MHGELESQVWLLVQKAYDHSAFVQLIGRAVSGDKRAPGYDPLVRLHASNIGLTGVQVLRKVLEQHGIDAGGSESYIELRSRLKTHLGDQLQWHLVKNELAIDEMKDDQLGKDLGL